MVAGLARLYMVKSCSRNVSGCSSGGNVVDFISILTCLQKGWEGLYSVFTAPSSSFLFLFMCVCVCVCVCVCMYVCVCFVA